MLNVEWHLKMAKKQPFVLELIVKYNENTEIHQQYKRS